eukprot:401319_1
MSFFNMQSAFLGQVFQTNMQASCYNYGYVGVDTQPRGTMGWDAHRQAVQYTKYYDKTGQHQLAYVSRTFKDVIYETNSPAKDPNAICTDKYYKGKNMTNKEVKENHIKTRKDWHGRCNW